MEPEDKKPRHGGARPNSGRKIAPGKQARKPYAVSLEPSENNWLVHTYGSLTKAVQRLLPVSLDAPASGEQPGGKAPAAAKRKPK